MKGDFCDKDGAWKLKIMIEEYWATRGFVVSIRLIDAGFVPAMRTARTDVRSNMVNGMPPKMPVSHAVRRTISYLPPVPGTSHRIALRRTRVY